MTEQQQQQTDQPKPPPNTITPETKAISLEQPQHQQPQTTNNANTTTLATPIPVRSASASSVSPGIDDEATPMITTTSISSLTSDTLEDLCYLTLVTNFSKKPQLMWEKGIPKRVREKVFGLLQPGSIPLEIAGKFITGNEGEGFWKRSSLLQWPHANIREHGMSWKRLYFEITCSKAIENFGQQQSTPSKTTTTTTTFTTNNATNSLSMEKLEALLMAARDHVFSLQVSQLHSHLSPIFIFNCLCNLTNCCLFYGTLKSGTGLDWTATPGMTKEDCMRLGKAISSAASLTTLSLSGNSINDDLVEILSSGIEVNHTLTSIDLSHNHLTSKGLSALLSALAFKNPEESVVVNLTLSDNLLGPDSAPALVRLLKTCESLEKLDVGMNALNESLPSILLAAAESRSLVHLRVSSNSGNEKSIAESLSSLIGKHCPQSLETLDISENALDESSGNAILSSVASLSETSCKLTAINLSGCGLSKTITDSVEVALEKLRSARRKKILNKK